MLTQKITSKSPIQRQKKPWTGGRVMSTNDWRIWIGTTGKCNLLKNVNKVQKHCLLLF